MKKTIILNENAFKKIRGLIIKEASAFDQYYFGTSRAYYKPYLDKLAGMSNLRVDRYKNNELEEAYNNWANANFDKSSYEYVAWGNALTAYMKFFAGGIEFVLNHKVRRIGLGGKYYWVFIDEDWIKTIDDTNDYKDKECIYPLILKIYQNKPMWNDLFFNPLFSDMKNDFMQIKQFIGAAIGKYPNVKLLLPIEEYREINKYINSGEAKPELFYEPPKYYDDEDEFGID